MVTFKAIGHFGRLGNQLFQIAAVEGLASKYGHSAVFPRWPGSDILPIGAVLPQRQTFDEITWTQRSERSFAYDESIFEPIAPSDNINLYGYFQSERYFEHCRAGIKNLLLHTTTLNRRKAIASKYNISEDNKVCAIHVRRGDYVNLPDHYVDLASTKYYPTAILEMIKGGIDDFLVFSDDIAYCKTVIRKGFMFSEETTAFDDLLLMSACNYHIIANSSFSWWGSWLAESRRTIAPKAWFGPAITHDTKDLYRSNMEIM